MSYTLAKAFGILETIFYFVILIYSASIAFTSPLENENKYMIIAYIINCIIVLLIFLNGIKVVISINRLESIKKVLENLNKSPIQSEYIIIKKEEVNKQIKEIQSNYEKQSRKLWLLPLIHIIYIAILIFISYKTNK